MLFHVKRLIIINIACLISNFIYGQGSIILSDKPFIFKAFEDSILTNWLNSYPEFTASSKEERENVYWINIARSKPIVFLNNIVNPFLEQFPEVKSAYTKSLITELSQLKPLDFLQPKASLYSIAQTHASDLGSHQLPISHHSSKGQSFQERMNSFGYVECISENIYEGKENGILAVLFLLIDSGVKNLGHRRNILSAEMKYIGVSFTQVKNNDKTFYLVQNFACPSK